MLRYCLIIACLLWSISGRGQDWEVIETVDENGTKTGETVVRTVIAGVFSNDSVVNQQFCGIAEVKRMEGNKKHPYFYLIHFKISSLCKDDFLVLLPYSVSFIASDGRRFNPGIQIKSFYGDKKQQDYLVQELLRGPVKLRVVSNGKDKIYEDGGPTGFYRFDLPRLDSAILKYSLITENVFY